MTGDMHAVDWQKHKSNWKHLENIEFPEVGPKPIVDILIGVDHSDLLYSLEDV